MPPTTTSKYWKHCHSDVCVYANGKGSQGPFRSLWRTHLADEAIVWKPIRKAKDAKHVWLRSWLRQAILCKEARAVKT